MQVDYPYLDVETALRVAYSAEAHQICVQSSYDVVIPATNPADVTEHERIAEGMMLKGVIMRPLGKRGTAVMDAKYTLPHSRSLTSRKNYNMNLLVAWVRSRKKADKWLVADAVRDFVGLRMDKSYRKWAEHLGVGISTVLRTCTSKYPADRSAMHYLKLWEIDARGRVEVELKEAGLIP